MITRFRDFFPRERNVAFFFLVLPFLQIAACTTVGTRVVGFALCQLGPLAPVWNVVFALTLASFPTGVVAMFVRKARPVYLGLLALTAAALLVAPALVQAGMLTCTYI